MRNKKCQVVLTNGNVSDRVVYSFIPVDSLVSANAKFSLVEVKTAVD